VTALAVVGHVEWVDFVGLARLPAPGEIMPARGVRAAAAAASGVRTGLFGRRGFRIRGPLVRGVPARDDEHDGDGNHGLLHD
jgi:hypothetical protein